MEPRVEPYHPSGNLLSLVKLAGLTRASTRAQPEQNLVRRWGLEEDDLDLRAVQARLDKAWRQWSFDQREHVLVTAECLAFAERQKQLWNPKENAERYRRLSKTAIAAARLAEALAAIFPPPWDGERPRVGHVIDELSTFVVGALRATTFPAVRGAALEARLQMTRARAHASDTRSGPPPWELIRDLAWLASNKQVFVSERTIRRYLKAKPLKTPAFQSWKRHWDLVGPVVQRLSRPQVSEVERAAKAYLDPAGSPPVLAEARRAADPARHRDRRR